MILHAYFCLFFAQWCRRGTLLLHTNTVQMIILSAFLYIAPSLSSECYPLPAPGRRGDVKPSGAPNKDKCRSTEARPAQISSPAKPRLIRTGLRRDDRHRYHGRANLLRVRNRTCRRDRRWPACSPAHTGSIFPRAGSAGYLGCDWKSCRDASSVR